MYKSKSEMNIDFEHELTYIRHRNRKREKKEHSLEGKKAIASQPNLKKGYSKLLGK